MLALLLHGPHLLVDSPNEASGLVCTGEGASCCIVQLKGQLRGVWFMDIQQSCFCLMMSISTFQIQLGKPGLGHLLRVS